MIDNAALAVPEVAGVAGKIALAVEEEVLARHAVPLTLSGSAQGIVGGSTSSQDAEKSHVPQGDVVSTDDRASHSEEKK